MKISFSKKQTFLGTLTGLLGRLRVVDELNLSWKQQINVIRHEEDQNIVDEDMKKVMNAVNDYQEQKKFPFLQHPGRVLFLKSNSLGKDEKILLQDHENQDSLSHPTILYLLRKMLVDHTGASYQAALGVL